MRSRAPPVADAARRSIRSGRKNRASEQREDFFGHRKAVGANASAATLGAYLCAVRTMLLHRSYPALQATERGSSRGKLSPLTVFWFLLYAQKERLRGERCLLCLCKRLRDADRRDEIWCEGGSRCAGAGLRLVEEFRRQAATPSAFYRIQQKCRRTQTNVCNLRGDVLH